MSISFNDESHLLAEMHALLKAEQQALIDNDVDAVEEMLDKKSTLIQALSLKTNTRYQQLARLGYSPDENGMADWVMKKADNAIRSLWIEFQAVLTQAKELNRLNAMLVGKFLSRNQKMISALQKPTGQATALYGPNGQSTFGRPNRGAVIS